LIYGIKLFFPIFLLWALSLWTMKIVFRDLLNAAELRASMIVTLIYTAASFLSFRPQLFLLTCFGAALVAQHLLGGDIRAKLTAFWMAVILFPPISLAVTGVAGLNYLIDLDHLRIAEIALLLPAAVQILFSKREARKSIWWLDAAVVSYPLLCIIVQFPHVTFTASIRSFVEMCLDVVLPYYVVTRGLRNWEDLNFVLKRFLLACVFSASVALLEAVLRRNIYAELQWVYGVKWSLTHTLMRGGFLRVESMAPNPVMLAIQIGITIGLWFAMTAQGLTRTRTWTVLTLLTLALLCTWSRGPLLGTMVFGLGMLCLTKLGPRVFGVLLVAAIAGGIAAKMAGLDETAIALLKEVLSNSKEDALTIDYRSRLLDTSLELIKQSPWMGVPNYATYMQDLVQGEGIIDMVNTYVGVALNAGVVGLAMFLSPVILMTIALLRRLGAGHEHLGRPQAAFLRACIALMVGSLVTIFTTSIFERVPLLMLLLVAAPGAMIGFDPAMTRSTKRSAPRFGGQREFQNASPNQYADL
jgi:hypothetical protein